MKFLNRISIAVAVSIACSSAVQAQGLGFASLTAVVDIRGETIVGAGVQRSSRVGTGVYVVEFTRDVSSCTIIATARGRRPGFASVRHPAGGLSPNVVKIFTFSPTGVATNIGFNILVNCVS